MIRQTSAVTLVLLLVGACGGADSSTGNTVSCAGAVDAETSSLPSDADVVKPEQALDMSIARVLGTDQRFSWFHSLAEQTMSPMGLSWLDIWDFPASRMGDNEDSATVFVPVDDAFGRLEPAMLAALEEGRIDNDPGIRCWAITTFTGSTPPLRLNPVRSARGAVAGMSN